jgi:precorrin-2 dehydrogenase/sirohydrochlorin ferrochelatase
MTSFYPLHVRIEGKKCLVVGGGKTAERKVSTLLRYGGKVVLVSPDATSYLRSQSSRKKIVWHRRRFKTSDLHGAFLVFSATGSGELNREVGREANKKSILFNLADNPEACDFISPSLVERGHLTVSIATDGLAPLLSKKIRHDLEKYFDKEYRRYTELVAQVRSVIIADDTLTAQAKKRKLQLLLSLPVLNQLVRGKRVNYKDLLKKLNLSGLT